MVDTGAAPNLIKKIQLLPNVRIDPQHLLRLTGITKGQVDTLELVETNVHGHAVKFHVVPDNFPMTQDGILGSEFLSDVGKINFVEQTVDWRDASFPFEQWETVTIPARSNAVLSIKIMNEEVKIGYVPRLRLDDRVCLGDAVVTNRNGKAYLRAFNIDTEDLEIRVPSVELEEIDILPTPTICLDEPVLETELSALSLRNPIDAVHNIFAIINSSGNRANKVNNLLRLEHLNREEALHVQNFITKYSDIFHLPDDKLESTNVLKHTITTVDEQPVNTKQYRFPPIHKDEIDKQVKQLLHNDVIKHSTSPYVINSPLWIVPKKADSKGNRRWRMVIDYRALIEKTVGDVYPLPNITEILDQLGSAKYFSVFDLASGFHQIQMHERDGPKTAFSTPYGHYEFNRMPFGLKNAPATFQRLIDHVLAGLQGAELFVYLDDIVLYASSLHEHEIKFERLAARLRNANLKLQPDKCEFLRKEVTLATLSAKTAKPDPKKVEAVREFPRPTNQKNIKQFLGRAGYYRRFIPNFSKIAKSLTGLLKKEAAFVWTEKQTEAFTSLRDALCSQPILQYPDFTRPFVVITDASKNAIGGILSQGPVRKDLPISYVSRLLNSAEQNYSTIERELFAIVYCVNYFRPYLFGRKFQLVTNYKPLVWLNSVKDPSSRLVRWRLKLAEYDYEMTYKAGKINANTDALSRNPVPRAIPPLSLSDPNDSSSSESTSQENKIISELTQTSQISSNKQHKQEFTKSDVVPENEYLTDARTTDETASETDSDSESECAPPDLDIPYEPRHANIQIIPDNFLMRKDNLVIFTTEQGNPCDAGARTLAYNGKLPQIRNATVGRAKVIREGSRYLIALIIKNSISETIEREMVTEAIAALLDVTVELDLRSLSICKGNVDNVPWINISNILYDTFRNLNVRIFAPFRRILHAPIKLQPHYLPIDQRFSRSITPQQLAAIKESPKHT